MRISHTRAMVHAALSGLLDEVPMRVDEVFNVQVPLECPEVPSEVLDPRSTWSDAGEYDQTARRLASMFVENFRKYEAGVGPEVVQSGPHAA
jgi:phosphoenolpyruvate carboxykinase (ATP)